MNYGSKNMKISERLKLFREANTLKEHERNKSILSVKNVNSHIENDSFLYQGGTERRPTLKDKTVSVFEEIKSIDLGFAVKGKKILHLFSPEKRTIKKPQPAFSAAVATLNNYIDLLDLDSNIELKFYLADAPVTIKQMITRNDGTIEIIDAPVKELNGYQILSPELKLSKEIIGKHEGETFEVDNWYYKILKIQE